MGWTEIAAFLEVQDILFMEKAGKEYYESSHFALCLL